MSPNKIIIGVLTGMAAGALAGILFAPAKGSKTRRRIIKKGERYAAGLKQNLKDMNQGAGDNSDDAHKQVKGFADRKRQKSQETQKFVKSSRTWI